MFEQLVATLLNRVLGDYVDNLGGEQLNIGIWQGVSFAAALAGGRG